jgi:transcriptional regulator with XRE-family HTH domain
VADTYEKHPLHLDGLGARIRTLRKARRLSLVELSGASKVSVAMISQIETGQVTPSLKTLEKLRLALDVPLGSFFSQNVGDSRRSRPIVVRRDARRALTFGRLGLVKELLSPDGASGLEVMELVLTVDGSSGEEPWVRSGEKAGVVVSGRFVLTHGADSYELGPGDSFQFDGSIPHMFRNGHAGETRVLWIIKADAG